MTMMETTILTMSICNCRNIDHERDKLLVVESTLILQIIGIPMIKKINYGLLRITMIKKIKYGLSRIMMIKEINYELLRTMMIEEISTDKGMTYDQEGMDVLCWEIDL